MIKINWWWKICVYSWRYLYFPKNKLAVEVDEKEHTGRDKKKENEGEEKIKEELGCKFIRSNPDEKSYAEYVEFCQISNHVSEAN